MRYIIKKRKSEVIVTRKHRTVRSKTLTNRKEKAIIREIKKDPNILATKLIQMVANYFGKNIHEGIMSQNFVTQWFPWWDCKKPFVNKNQARRLNSTKQFMNEDTTFWDKIMFSDERKYNVFRSNGHRMSGAKPMQKRILNIYVLLWSITMIPWRCVYGYKWHWKSRFHRLYL